MRHKIAWLMFCLFLLFAVGGSRERRLLTRVDTTEEKIDLSTSTEGHGDCDPSVDVLRAGKAEETAGEKTGAEAENVAGDGATAGEKTGADESTAGSETGAASGETVKTEKSAKTGETENAKTGEIEKTGETEKNGATEKSAGMTQAIRGYSESDPGFEKKITQASVGTGESFSVYCRGRMAHTLKFSAEFHSIISSLDDYYYLIAVDPRTEEPDGIPLSRVEKGQRIRFLLDTSEHPEYVQKRYCLAVRTGVGYSRITAVKTVRYAERMADNTEEYRIAETKKGIQQDSSTEEIFETDSKQVFLNISTTQILDSGEPPVSFLYDGESYTFRSMDALQSQVRRYNENGIVVTAQILLDDVSPDLILEEARKGKAAFYTWNTRDKEARRKMEAIFSYLAEIFGREDCYITNWILGNEINSCESWNYCGDIDGDTYVRIYCEAFQSLYKAVRSRKSGTKLFLCLDHNWNTAAAGYSSRYILDKFAARIKQVQPDLQWNLAYHAYPSPLTEVAFWKNHVTDDLSSSIIHMGNLQVLTDYIRDTYGSSTRILLSEQGFTSTQGEPLQAAALCYAYYIAACNPMIDGFHIRSFRDNEVEASQGLMMGIQGKEAYQVYCVMDTASSLENTARYVGLTGLKSWEEIPGFSPEKLYTNYREE